MTAIIVSKYKIPHCYLKAKDHAFFYTLDDTGLHPAIEKDKATQFKDIKDKHAIINKIIDLYEVPQAERIPSVIIFNILGALKKDKRAPIVTMNNWEENIQFIEGMRIKFFSSIFRLRGDEEAHRERLSNRLALVTWDVFFHSDDDWKYDFDKIMAPTDHTDEELEATRVASERWAERQW